MEMYRDNRKMMITQIGELLSSYATDIKENAKLNDQSGAIYAEENMKDILNILLDADLVNGNKIDHNLAGIDLLDEKKKIGIQVTATKTAEKIRSTLNKTYGILQDSGWRIKIMFLSVEDTEIQKLKRKEEVKNDKLSFLPSEDILDFSWIKEEIMYLNDERLSEIHALVQKKLQKTEEYNAGKNDLAESFRERFHASMFLEETRPDQKTTADMYQLPFFQKPVYPERISWKIQEKDSDSIRWSYPDPSLDTFLGNTINRKGTLVIFGLPGIGKSTLYQWMLNQSTIGDTKVSQEKVYVYRFSDVPKRLWTEEDSTVIFANILTYMGVSAGRELKGQILLWDGFDEIQCSEGLRISLIKEFISQTRDICTVFITCRLHYIPLGDIREIPFIRLNPFTEDQIKEYIQKYQPIDTGSAFYKLVTEKEHNKVFGLPVVLYMSLAVLGSKVEFADEREITVFSVYNEIFRKDGGIFDLLSGRPGNQGYDKIRKDIDEEKKQALFDTSKELAVWMFNHDQEDCPEAEARKILVKCGLHESTLSAGLFLLKYLDISGKQQEDPAYKSFKELRFVHKSIYEYFTAVAVCECFVQMITEPERAAVHKAELARFLHGSILKKSREIWQFLQENLSEKAFIPAISVLESMLSDGMIDTREFWVLDQLKKKGEHARILPLMENCCFKNMTDLLQIVREKSNKERIILNVKDQRVKAGLEKLLRQFKVFYPEESLDLSGCTLDGLDLSGINLNGCRLDDIHAEKTDFRNADLTDCSMKNAVITGADFNGAKLSGIHPDTVKKIRNSEGFSWAVFSKTNPQTHWKNELIPGGLYEFGSYPQGADGEIERILWRVLDVDTREGKALLLSDQILDVVPYNNEYKSTSWEHCTLRKWLNGPDKMVMEKEDGFLYRAFSESERERILITDVKRDKNPHSEYRNTVQGKAVKNKIFLLSGKEVVKYFAGRNIKEEMFSISMGGLQAAATETEYAKRQSRNRLWVNEKLGTCGWWLRSVGSSPRRSAMYVKSDGDVDCDGSYVHSVGVGVRPALWISLKS